MSHLTQTQKSHWPNIGRIILSCLPTRRIKAPATDTDRADGARRMPDPLDAAQRLEGLARTELSADEAEIVTNAAAVIRQQVLRETELMRECNEHRIRRASDAEKWLEARIGETEPDKAQTPRLRPRLRLVHSQPKNPVQTRRTANHG